MTSRRAILLVFGKHLQTFISLWSLNLPKEEEEEILSSHNNVVTVIYGLLLSYFYLFHTTSEQFSFTMKGSESVKVSCELLLRDIRGIQLLTRPA